MQLISFVTILLSVVAARPSGGAFPPAGGAIEAGPDTQFPADYVMEYYADYCRHCKDFAPAYGQAATNMNGAPAFYRVDCADSTKSSLCKGIDGFPTVQLFKGGRPFGDEYSGDRSVDSVVQYAQQLTQ